jgi:hypothetical protein
MTDFPELQHALVDAARRRHAPRRRAWRVLRVAVPAAAAVALIAVLAGERTSDERPATPSPTPAATLAPIDPLSRNYEVFRRPSARTDALPGKPVTPPDEPGTTIENRPRLLFERGDSRFYAVQASRRDASPLVCVLQFVGDVQEAGSCNPVVENPALGGTVTWVPVLLDGAAAIAALAADDISELEVEFPDGTSERHPFAGGAVLVPADPWPSGLTWMNTAGHLVGVDLSTEQPGG